MNFLGSVKQLPWFVLSILLCLAIGAHQIFAQPNNDPLRLQKEGIGKIDHWTDYVRRTGDAKSTVSELASAQSDLKASYDLFLKRGDLAAASWSAIKLGDVQRLTNQFRDAGTIYRDAVELARRAGRADYQAKALAEVAFCELRLGEMDAAEDHSREAVKLAQDSGNKSIYFDALDVAGEVEVKRANLVAAAEYLDRALAMSGQIDDKRLLYRGYSDRADIYYQRAVKCDYQRTFDVCYQAVELSRADYQKALAITQDLGFDFFSQFFRDLLKQLDDRKALLQGMQRNDQAATEAKFFSPKKPSDVLVTESFATGVASSQNLALIENAVKEMQDWRDRLRRQGLTVPDLDSSNLFIQGDLEEMKGNNDAALTAFQRAADLLENDRRNLRDEQSRGAFMEDKMDTFYRPALLLLDRKRYPEAFALFERSRSRAMADLLASQPLTLGTSTDRNLFSQLQTMKTSIAAQQEKLFNLTASQNRDQNIKEITRLENQIGDLQQQYQQVETRIAKEAPKLKQLTSSVPVSLESTQRAAAEGGYDVLYYVVMGHAVILWHINGRGVQAKNIFLPQAQLIKKTAALHDSLIARRDAPDAKFNEDISRQLFLYLIQPVLSSIQSNHLIIVPQEELNSIPFQALQNPETGECLGERFAISYVPSATVLATLESKPNLKNGRLLAVADPGIHDARDEVDAIGRLYPGRSKVVSQTLANKAELKMWVTNYNVVHFSVHGKFDASDPLLSYLQFADVPPDHGHLTAADMFGLPLQKNSFVVLSACETGRVQATHANEIVGMVRSLLYAGAGSLVLSSWEVNAGSTRFWMETFYREAQTKPPTEAARLALIAVKSRPEYSHPFFWAPFVLTGK